MEYSSFWLHFSGDDLETGKQNSRFVVIGKTMRKWFIKTVEFASFFLFCFVITNCVNQQSQKLVGWRSKRWQELYVVETSTKQIEIDSTWLALLGFSFRRRPHLSMLRLVDESISNIQRIRKVLLLFPGSSRLQLGFCRPVNRPVLSYYCWASHQYLKGKIYQLLFGFTSNFLNIMYVKLLTEPRN